MKTHRTLFTILMTTCLLFSCKNIYSNTGEVKIEKYIGLQLYSLRDDIKKDFDGTIKAVSGMGYKFIEAAGYDGGKFYGLSPQEFKAKIEGAGMDPLSSHTSRTLDINNPDDKALWAWWDECIDSHVAAGMKYIVMPWMPTFEKLSELKIYCDYMNKIGRKCKAKGLKFGYHNHDFEFRKVEDHIMYDYMLENTDPTLVFFQMDVYWTVMGGKSPVEYFEKYPGRFEQLHIKDHKELGQSGMIGFDAIFNHAAVAGMKYQIVEVEEYSYPPKKSVKLSLDYLNNADFVNADYSK